MPTSRTSLQRQTTSGLQVRRTASPRKQRAKPQRRLLDLFSGTGSLAAVFRQHGYAVTTVDVDAKMKPDIVADVLSWNYRGLPQGHFDVVFAAPPCTEYSQAMTGRPRNLEKADAIVRRTLEIIQYLKPKQWFLENSRHGVAEDPWDPGPPPVSQGRVLPVQPVGMDEANPSVGNRRGLAKRGG